MSNSRYGWRCGRCNRCVCAGEAGVRGGGEADEKVLGQETQVRLCYCDQYRISSLLHIVYALNHLSTSIRKYIITYLKMPDLSSPSIISRVNSPPKTTSPVAYHHFPDDRLRRNQTSQLKAQ